MAVDELAGTYFHTHAILECVTERQRNAMSPYTPVYVNPLLRSTVRQYIDLGFSLIKYKH